ncbi:MAG: AMMECR1 domain-containing protein [Candidatus Muirbacterium halophilum]|nr:AMMECR1 domain-containing protein [Candidatus Muirbacterium halophilum]MCK9475381.1 AMMECR1 domain-containing protein [Candidatus Muirbacterium halophilum]
MINSIKKELELFVRNILNEYITNSNVFEFDEKDYPEIFDLKSGIGIIVKHNNEIIGEACHITMDRTFLLNLRDMLLMVIKGDSKKNMPDPEQIKNMTFELFLTERIKAVKSIDNIDVSKQGLIIQQLGKTAFRLPEKTKKTNVEIITELIEKTGCKVDKKDFSGFLIFSFSVEKFVF